MVFHRVLDVVFSTWSHTAVLRALQDSAVGVTGREIARLAGMNHRSCLKALSTLESISIVNRQMGGRDHLFTLNRDHLLVSEGILPLLKLEREFLQRFSTLLKKHLGRVVDSIILFGSVARRVETSESDLDICLVIDDKKQKEEVLDRIHIISPEVRRQFGANLSPFVITASEFRKRSKTNKSPVNNIVNEGIVISGQSIKELIRARE